MQNHIFYVHRKAYKLPNLCIYISLVNYNMNENIPLNLRLKKKFQKDLALAQDIIIGHLYKFFPNAIIHGGTAIWRCYSGNRFSEDVDAYIERDKEKIYAFIRSLETRGFKIIKTRIKENSVYTEFDFNSITTKFEATHQQKSRHLMKYETSESFFINVFTLTPEDLVIEKVETYLNRKKIRDLYDIYFLLNHVKNKELVKPYLKKLIFGYSKPIDEENLKNIILVGAVPSSNELLLEIKKWEK